MNHPDTPSASRDADIDPTIRKHVTEAASRATKSEAALVESFQRLRLSLLRWISLGSIPAHVDIVEAERLTAHLVDLADALRCDIDALADDLVAVFASLESQR